MLFTFLICHTLQDEISSPISARLFELCDNELFQETLQNSEVTSSSNYCHEDISSYAINLSSALDLDNNNNNNNKITSNSNSNNSNNIVTTPSSTTSTTTTINNNNNNLSTIFDSHEEIDNNDISASIDFSSSHQSFIVPPLLQQEQQQFDFSSSVLNQYPPSDDPIVAPPLIGAPLPLLPCVFEDDCISSIPSYMPLNNNPSSPTCSYLSPGLGLYMPQGQFGNSGLSTDNSGLFGGGSVLLGSELQTQQELDYQGENGGFYCTDSVPGVFNPSDFQVFVVNSN